jgi:hypothetical protein
MIGDYQVTINLISPFLLLIQGAEIFDLLFHLLVSAIYALVDEFYMSFILMADICSIVLRIHLNMAGVVF